MKIVALSDLNPAAYNPRRNDPQRLDLIEISLRKLGWLLPIVAEPGGEILSGHQRQHVAMRMGATHAPVHETRVFTLQERKGLNLVFNRATNDLREADTPKSLTEALSRLDITALSAKVPDRDIHDPSWFRCAHAKMVPTSELTAANRGRWLNYALAAAKPLRIKGIEMPVICTSDLVVVNGIGRLQDAAEQSRPEMPVVFVSDDEAALSAAFLNLLTMDFDVHGRYADELRFNSFRRMRTRGRIRSAGANNLGKGFTIALPRAAQKGFTISRATDRKTFRELHGEVILDFGAGRLEDTKILREHGFDATGFEPFVPAEGKDSVDTELSRRVGRTFLERVAQGTRWSSIVLASVLNSVPFKPDRQKIIALIDGEVSRVFDDMLARSIPQIEVMRGLVTDFARAYAQPGTSIVDLGCSAGGAMAPLVEAPECSTCSFLGVEVSAPMRDRARQRFAGRPNVEIVDTDLRRAYPEHRLASVTLAVLTLQFIPIEHRQRVIRNAYRNTMPGGALIVVEKVLGASSELDDLFVRRYLAQKAANGYTSEEIDRKRSALEGVLVPLTAAANEEMLRAEGWLQVECAWRWCNFAAWIALR